MTKKIEDGGPAFPHMAADGHPDYRLGLSLRDWFAGQALVGLIPAYQAAYGSPTAECMEIVQEAYGYADIMLAHRNSGGEA